MLLDGVQLIMVEKNQQFKEKLNCLYGEMKIVIEHITNRLQIISCALVTVKGGLMLVKAIVVCIFEEEISSGILFHMVL